jgi:hypothetical protein
LTKSVLKPRNLFQTIVLALSFLLFGSHFRCRETIFFVVATGLFGVVLVATGEVLFVSHRLVSCGFRQPRDGGAHRQLMPALRKKANWPVSTIETD